MKISADSRAKLNEAARLLSEVREPAEFTADSINFSSAVGNALMELRNAIAMVTRDE